MEKLAEMPDPEPQNTDFLECVRTRRKFALDEQIGHRSSTLVNLGACALRLNRTLHFDPDATLHRRRCRQPTDRSADARPVAYLAPVTMKR